MIFEHDSLSEFLSAELRRRLRVNPSYSLRSFARNLNISPGALSEILRGQRELSLKAVPSVAKAIGLNAAEGEHLLLLAQNAKVSKDKSLAEFKQSARLREHDFLAAEVFNLVSEWYHFAILNMLDLEEFEWKAVWIAKRLGISRLQSQMAMDLLIRLNLVVKRNGRHTSKAAHVMPQTDVPSAAVRAYHRQILEKAILALESQNVEERDISGSGFAVDVKHLPALKKDLSEFQDRILAKYAKGKKSEVYFLEIALFKLTQGDKK